MRSQRTFRLIAIVLVLAVLGWLLLPGEQQPVPGPGSEVPTQAQGATGTQSRGDSDRLPVPRDLGRVGSDHGPGALPGFLPPEAAPVILRIQQGGRFPHRQDGSVFGNRERRLPQRGHGYYREYTVPTPGVSHRGARRIVTGGDPPRDWYYTDDHYDSFRAFQPPPRDTLR